VRTRSRLVAIVATGATAAIVAVAVARRSDPDAGGEAPADTSFMRAMHDALRRDLDRVRDGDVSGWSRFRQQLDIHHRAEDDDLWPRLRGTVEGALLDEMVAEHAEILAALDAVDRARRDGRSPAAEIAGLRRVLSPTSTTRRAPCSRRSSAAGRGHSGVSGCSSSAPSGPRKSPSSS
jgi:hypothetical protein